MPSPVSWSPRGGSRLPLDYIRAAGGAAPPGSAHLDLRLTAGSRMGKRPERPGRPPPEAAWQDPDPPPRAPRGDGQPLPLGALEGLLPPTKLTGPPVDGAQPVVPPGRPARRGRDVIGEFLIRGRYDVADGKCWWTKRYV